MSLVHCRECKKKISKSADPCPNCGCVRPTPQSYRKDRWKLIDTGIGVAVIIIIIILLFFW